MKGGRRRCRECGKLQVPSTGDLRGAGETCAACGAALEGRAFSDFADRLARFGLGEAPRPLLRGLPELPHAD